MKSNLDKFFKTSDDLERNGVWYEIADGVAFLVKPMKGSNPNVKAALAALYRPYARQIELGSLSDEKVLEINIKVFVQACMVDWKGVEIDGALTAFSPEIAVKFLIGLPDLFETLWNHSKNSKNYQEEDQEALGNSSSDT